MICKITIFTIKFKIFGQKSQSKQSRYRSDCSFRSSLICICSVYSDFRSSLICICSVYSDFRSSLICICSVYSDFWSSLICICSVYSDFRSSLICICSVYSDFSDQCLHCLPFHLHLPAALLLQKPKLFHFFHFDI